MAYFGETSASKGDDKTMSVRFYKRLVQKKYAKNQKHPGLQDKDFEWRNVEMDYVEIKNIGNRLQVYDQPVRQKDKERFSYQWKMYQDRLDQAPKGIPLSACAALNDADIRMLETHGFVTVEQIIGMSDADGQRFHAGLAIRKRVADWHEVYMEEASSGRVADLEKQLAALQAKFDEKPETPEETTEEMIQRMVKDQMQAATTPPKNKGGRPKGSKNGKDTNTEKAKGQEAESTEKEQAA